MRGWLKKNQEHIIEKIKNQVPSALFPEIKSKLACPALITALSSRLDKAISIDNGIMHMMSLANVPMIVLFGPTNSDKFAPNNNFTTILDSKKIHKTKDFSSECQDAPRAACSICLECAPPRLLCPSSA